MLTLLLALAPALPAIQDWPQFRGPRASGVAPADFGSVPAEWDALKGEKIAWKTPVPGLAHSSPIARQGRLYVTSAVKKEGEAELSSLYGSPGYGAGESVKDEGVHLFRLYCLDAQTGKILWQRTAHEGVPEVMRHPKSTHASSTPACDAKRVIAFFGSDGLFAYDHDGELLWKTDFGKLDVGAPGYGKEGYQWGFASSPVLYGDHVIVQVDHEGDSFVAALSADTGKELWRTARDENSTWCSPAVHEVSAREGPQVILNGYQHIGGYELATGKEIWKLVGGGDVPVPTPVVDGELIFLTSAHGRSRPLRAVHVRAEGTLDPDADEEEHLVWELPRRGVYMQTPLVHEGLVYACSDGGILGCYRAATGEEVYKERLGSGETGFSGSPVLADGKLYFSGESGVVYVVKAGPEFEVLAENDLGETCLATPALAVGTIFFRTRNHVIAVRD